MADDAPNWAFRVGIAGPVGSGKTALVDRLSRQLFPKYNLAVVANDIYTGEDVEFLLRQGTLPAERVKGGFIAWSVTGDPNASIPTPQPVLYRPMFGSFGTAPAQTAITIVSQAALTAGVPDKLGLKKIIRPVSHCRRIGKTDMLHNNATPNIEVDPETYEVRVDGKVITCEPATVLPLAQRYFLF